LRAAALAIAFLDRITAGTVARPDVTGFGGAPGVRINFYGLRDHERRVETDTELADEAGVFLGTFAECLEKFFRAGVGDGAEIRDQLGLRHADAKILNRKRLRLVV